ncbi:9942_t:CDS:1 [Funneliformis mosseae]|uniref:9942_t:CDS:1 n=1 Tax=Funneliformis mosseae TaxID=27381 RepID=A0A9N9AJU9_FUNMO|nr:9942_t:CDS:1 [Funneliformis mosseae]
MGQIESLERKISLGDDLRQLINDDRFFDITLKCSDKTNLSACKAILATRSKVFNSLIGSGSNNELSFSNINSDAMKVVIEYLYTSDVEEQSLTINNIVEVYYASIHFKLTSLQKLIIDRTKKFLKGGPNISKNLLSQLVKKCTSRVDNEMSQMLIVWVSKNKLGSYENDENDPLSLEGLKYLLMKTFDDTKTPFATSEFDIWNYTLKKVISIATNNRKTDLSKCNTDEKKEVKIHLTPFTYYIDLNRMDVDEIMKYIEPVNIYSIEKLKDIYCNKARDKESANIRGVPAFKWNNNSTQLIVSNYGSTVEMMKPNNTKQKPVHKSILGDMMFKNLGKYEWNIVIEKLGGIIYIGICGDESLSTTELNYHGWVLGSDGYVYRKKDGKCYDAKMKEGDNVTIHLNISTVHKRRKCECSFSINGSKKPVVSARGWDDIPCQVYPIVSLSCGSKLRIEPVSSV